MPDSGWNVGREVEEGNIFLEERGLPSEEIACKIVIEEIIVINYPAPWHVTLSISKRVFYTTSN